MASKWSEMIRSSKCTQRKKKGRSLYLHVQYGSFLTSTSNCILFGFLLVVAFKTLCVCVKQNSTSLNLPSLACLNFPSMFSWLLIYEKCCIIIPCVLSSFFP